MVKKLPFRLFLVAVLMVILYEIWPLPFWYVSKSIILPMAEKTGDFLYNLAGPFRFLGDMSKLDKKNKDLEQENNNLKAQISNLNENIHLCTAFKKESEAYKSSELEIIQGKIIGRKATSFNKGIIVNLGSKDQIKEGAAVLSSGYLIGQVKKVEETRSEVKLITAHDSLIPAVLEKSRETGLVQGGLEGLSLTEIPSTTQIKTQDNVLTSGLGDDLPSGILIGMTQEVKKQENNLFQSVKITSPIEISTIEIISIVR